MQKQINFKISFFSSVSVIMCHTLSLPSRRPLGIPQAEADEAHGELQMALAAQMNAIGAHHEEVKEGIRCAQCMVSQTS